VPHGHNATPQGRARLNVLFVVPNVPSSVRIRPFSFIENLAGRGHTVDCVCLSLGEQGESAAELSAVCREVSVVRLKKWRAMIRCATAVVQRVPLRAAYFADGEVLGEIAKRLTKSRYDLIHFEHLKSYRAMRRIRQSKSLPMVLDMVDCLSLLLRQQVRRSPRRMKGLLREELRRTESLERECLDSVRCFVTGVNDREALTRLVPSANVLAIPNGVRLGGIAEPRPIRSVVFWGKLDYAPNADAVRWICRNLAPALRYACPDLRLRIAGANSSAAQRREAMEAGVELTGYFTSVQALSESSEIAIAPIRFGAGVQNKVLEAMANGLPLVATQYAMRGLCVLDGTHFLQADTVQDFVKALKSLVANGTNRATMAREAFRLVRRDSSWQAATDKLERLYEDALTSGRGMKPGPIWHAP
jgi:polysaccharide biosynthesis protein PslH